MEGAGRGAGFSGSFGLWDTTGADWVTFFGGMLPPATNTPCGTVFARGLGDWILVVVCIGRGGSGSSSDSDSDSDDDEDAEDESEDDSSFSSRNSNTLGIFFAGSAGFCGWFSGTAGAFRACLDPLGCCEGELFATVLGLVTGPACVLVVFDSKEYVLFLPSFFGFLVWSGMMIGAVRNQHPIHTSSKYRYQIRTCPQGNKRKKEIKYMK